MSPYAYATGSRRITERRRNSARSKKRGAPRVSFRNRPLRRPRKRKRWRRSGAIRGKVSAALPYRGGPRLNRYRGRATYTAARTRTAVTTPQMSADAAKNNKTSTSREVTPDTGSGASLATPDGGKGRASAGREARASPGVPQRIRCRPRGKSTPRHVSLRQQPARPQLARPLARDVHSRVSAHSRRPGPGAPYLITASGSRTAAECSQ